MVFFFINKSSILNKREQGSYTCGMVKLPCVLLSPPFMKWLALKGLGLWISGRPQGRCGWNFKFKRHFND